MNTRGPRPNSLVLSVAILGPGAIGGFLAVSMARAGFEVVVIGKPEQVTHVKEQGISLKVDNQENLTVHPQVCSVLEEPVDIIFITTKSSALPGALPSIKNGLNEKTVVVPLLNGIEHMDIVRAHFGRHVVPATIGGIVAQMKQPQTVHATLNDVHVSLPRNGFRVDDIVYILETAGVRVVLHENEQAVLWSKFVRLAIIAGITAAGGGKTLGELRDDPDQYEVIQKLAEEVTAIATREGYEVDSLNVLEQINELPYNLTTSLQRDIEAGRAGESDALIGALIRRAHRYNLPNEALQEVMARIGAHITKRG